MNQPSEPKVRRPVVDAKNPERLGCIIEVTDTVFIVDWYGEDEPRGYDLSDWDVVVKWRAGAQTLGRLKVYRDGRDRGLWFAIEDNQSDNTVLIEWEALRRLGIVMGDERDRAAEQAMKEQE